MWCGVCEGKGEAQNVPLMGSRARDIAAAKVLNVDMYSHVASG